MKSSHAVRLAAALLLLSAFPMVLKATPPAGYYLVWSDEFNGSSLDTSKWALRLGGVYRDGYNTLNALSFNGSNMVITTYTANGTNYSAMLYAKGKFESKFGYWESNIKWSDSNAVWSSPWLLSRGYSLNNAQMQAAPDINDPATFGSEIDMCEHRYVDSSDTHNIANYVQVNVHWFTTGAKNVDDPGSPLVPPAGGLATGFHTYGFLWKTNSYSFLVDDFQVYSNRPTTPFVHAAEYPLLTSCVDDTGTTWAGYIPAGGYGSQTASATRFTIDYIRYYAPTNVHFWTGASSGSWSGSGNWLSNLPPLPGSDLTFSYNAPNRSMTPGQDYSVDGLVFLGSSGGYSINAGNTLTLGAGGIDMISANYNVTLSAAVNIAASQTWAVGPNDPNGGLTLTASGTVSGTGTLTKANCGTVVLSGANSFAGALNVDTGSSTANDGILKLANPSALAQAASPIAIRNTGAGVSIFQLDGSSGNMTLPQALSLAGRNSNVPALESLSGNNTLAGGITLAAGGNACVLQSDAGTLTLGGLISADSTATGNRALTLQGNGSFSIPGAIQNGSASALTLLKTNAGTLTLSGTNTCTGATTNYRGTLFVNGSLAGPMTVSGGILAGTGVVAGPVTVQLGSQLSPGPAAANAIGTLSFGNSLTLAAGSFTLMELNAASLTMDQVKVAGTLMYGGTLDVSNLGGTLAPGQNFKLFSAGAYSGNFVNVTLPSLVAGLAWSTSGLTNNGTLSVIALPEALTFTNLAGGQVKLTWLYGTLQSASNVSGPFADVPGAASPFVIQTTNAQQFYRVREE